MSWLGRLKEGLKKSSGKLVDGIGRALNIGRLDASSLDALHGFRSVDVNLADQLPKV
jgi:hypothetical protein